LILSSALRADVRPDDLCSEGMVLQRNTNARLWGEASAGEKITVTFRDQVVTTDADAKGKWQLKVATGDAADSLPMTIAGKNTLRYQNVAVGEVWFCAGQSNMEFRVSGDPADQTLAAAACPNPRIRYLNFSPIPNYHPHWIAASDPKAVDWFSTVAYFYGLNLQRKLAVPIGLIDTVAGGIPIEWWISFDVLQHDPRFGLPTWRNGLGQCFGTNVTPCAMYAIRGAIWYQGESNSRNGFEYRWLFPTMIQNWRDQWGQGDFPFFYVQIAPYRPVSPKPQESPEAELRESQALALTTVANTGMAVTTDLGDEGNVHPMPKHTIGERLALIARARVYGEKIEYSGPVFTGMKVRGREAILEFSHAGDGLISKELVAIDANHPRAARWRLKPDGSDAAPLLGFTICGPDHRFHNAIGTIDGARVLITSHDVQEPVAVRYGWADYPLCNLYNRAGLPASPFRTDDFPLLTRDSREFGLGDAGQPGK
jgi:sialate O-acetylesterase